MVVAQTNGVTRITEGRILISEGVLVTERPSIRPIRLAGADTFLVAVPQRLLELVRGIAIHLVVLATAIVAIRRRCVRIPPRLKSQLVLTQVVQVSLLITKLGQTPLLLQCLLPLSAKAILLFSFPSILRNPLLLRLLFLALALLIELRLPCCVLLPLLSVSRLLLLALLIQALLLSLLLGLPLLVNLLLPWRLLLPLLLPFHALLLLRLSLRLLSLPLLSAFRFLLLLRLSLRLLSLPLLFPFCLLLLPLLILLLGTN